MQILDQKLFDQVVAQAAENQRLRQNFNLHKDFADPCQRLLNAMEPGTYLRPHRHLTPPKAECFIALRGRLAAVIFADSGEVERILEFGAGGPIFGLELPAESWHTIISLQPGSLIFECKPGPYEPLSDKDWAKWAPAEGDEQATDFLQSLEDLVRQTETG